MLIRSVRAENFKKFSLLHLTNIPRTGIIGIEGPNESGKSSIGEAFLFAFFGRVNADDPVEISRLIRWGSDSLTVEIEFSVDTTDHGSGEYRIFRQIDRGGTNYVKVVRTDGQHQVFTGHVEVESFVSRTLRLELEDVWESVFLGQGAGDRGGVPTPEFLARLAGTAQIHEAVASFESEIVHLEREYANYQKDIGRNQDQIDKINHGLSRLGDLRGKVEKLSSVLASLEQKEKDQSNSQDLAKKLCEGLKRGADQLESASERTVDKISKCLDRELQKYELAESQDREFSVFRRVFKSVESQRSRLSEQRRQIESLRQFSMEFDELRQRYEALLEEYDALLDSNSSESLAGKRLELELRLTSRRRTRRRLFLLFLGTGLLTVICSAAGGFLGGGFPDASPFLEGIESSGLDSRIVWLTLLGVGGAFFLVSLGLFVRRVRMGGQIAQLGDQLKQCTDNLDETRSGQEKLRNFMSSPRVHSVSEFVEVVKGLDDQARYGYVVEFQKNHGECFGEGAKDYRKILRKLASGEREIRDGIQKEIQSVGKRLRDLGDDVNSKRPELDRARSEVRDAENLMPRKNSLVTKNEELEAGAADVLRELDQRRAAIELLQETERAIVGKIGPNVSRSVRGVLPALTDNRYRDLRLDDDLVVRLFTSEKCDFIDLHELSGGTLEALKLAFRLATSHVLTSSRLRQKQFLFLDEPFRLMDVERSVQAFGLLPGLSPVLSQFFVVQTSFTAAEKAMLQRLIGAGVQNGELVADLSQPIEGVLEPPAHDVRNLHR